MKEEAQKYAVAFLCMFGTDMGPSPGVELNSAISFKF